MKTASENLGVQGQYSSVKYTGDQATNAVWILSSAGFIFLMQAGFALVHAGVVTRKNRSAMLIKNIFNVALAGAVFWLAGYGLAFGGAKRFIGQGSKFFASFGFEQV